MQLNEAGLVVPAEVPETVLAAGVPRIALKDLSSRCTFRQVSSAARLDPYWSGMWGTGSNAYWDQHRRLMRQGEAGLRVSKRIGRRTPRQAAEAFLSGFDLSNRLRVLGAIDSWRTLTCEQAACITGSSRVLSPTNDIVWAAFEAGLLDIGSYATPMSKPHPRQWLLRPARTNAFERFVEPEITWPEWVSITGGMDWKPGGQYDRHNVLTTELALRVAEHCEVGTVLGEKFGRLEMLAGTGIGRTLAKHANQSADAVLVRPDGLRIAVELTATVNDAFVKKVNRWARILEVTPLAASGVVVVFVIAQPLGDRASGNSARNRAARIIHQAVNRHPGSAQDRTSARMMLVDWRTWFPGEHTASEFFATLRVKQPTGPAGSPWEEVDLLGARAKTFEPQDSDAMLDVLANAQGLAGVPIWLRDASLATQMWPELLVHHGFTDIPEPVRDGPGPAKEPTPPARLMML